MTLLFSRFRFVSGLLLSGLVFTAGCENEDQKAAQRIQAGRAASKERRDSIREAFQYLPQLIRVDRTAALQMIRRELNVWSNSIPQPPAWESSSLLDSIAPSLLTIDFSKRMKTLEFGEAECEYLLQCQMLSNVSRWVLDKPYKDELFAGWLEAQRKTLSAEDALKLENTLKLLDWTVCNVSTQGPPNEAETLATNPDLPLSDNGAIYRQLPWQTMMFARGESWQRARVFTQLLFSQGIDSVVLALPSPTGAVENASVRPWVVAVPIHGELYLFEPRWGLPIPSQSGDGIATLREAKENPAVLRRAKLPGLYEYPVEQKDLTNLIAMIDCEPFAVGRAMHTLQQSLTGENRIRISMDADEIERTLQQIDPKLSVRLWNVPWLSYVYNESLRKRLTEQSPFSMQYMEQNGIFVMDSPISRARLLHFKGDFDSTIEAEGALKAYMGIRVDEQTLKELEDNRDIQKELGVVRNAYEPLELFQARIRMFQSFYRRSKFDISIFLAMANADLNKPDTAIDWLSKRTLAVQGTERWHSQAHYLLGRMYEQTKNYKAAAEEYKFAESPQAAGNRIRLRKLRQMHPAEIGDE